MEKDKKIIVQLAADLGYTYYGKTLEKLKRKILRKEKYSLRIFNYNKKFYLDFHFIVKLKNFIFPSEFFVNNKLKSELSINILKPEYELLLIIANCFFKHKEVNLRDMFKFYYLYNRVDKEEFIELINKFNLNLEFSMMFNTFLLKNFFFWKMNIDKPNIELPKMNKNWTKIVNLPIVSTKLLKQLS